MEYKPKINKQDLRTLTFKKKMKKKMSEKNRRTVFPLKSTSKIDTRIFDEMNLQILLLRIRFSPLKERKKKLDPNESCASFFVRREYLRSDGGYAKQGEGREEGSY